VNIVLTLTKLTIDRCRKIFGSGYIPTAGTSVTAVAKVGCFVKIKLTMRSLPDDPYI